MPGKGYLDLLQLGIVRPLVFVGGVIVTQLAANTRFLTFNLGGAANVTATLPPMAEYPPGQNLDVRRIDADGLSTATVAASGAELIDGAPSIGVPVTSGLILSHDGLEWRVVANTT